MDPHDGHEQMLSDSFFEHLDLIFKDQYLNLPHTNANELINTITTIQNNLPTNKNNPPKEQPMASSSTVLEKENDHYKKKRILRPRNNKVDYSRFKNPRIINDKNEITDNILNGSLKVVSHEENQESIEAAAAADGGGREDEEEEQ